MRAAARAGAALPALHCRGKVALAVAGAAVALLSGCAQEPGPSVPVEAAVAVARAPCKVDVPDCGPYALGGVSEADRLVAKGRALLAEIKQREACELRLRAALKACTE